MSIDKVEIDIDPEYVKATAKLQTVDGTNVVDIDIDVIKEQADVEFQGVVYKYNMDHYEHFYKSDLESGCTHDAVKDPVLNFLFKETMKFGNITAACPLKVGHYQLKGFKIDTDDMPTKLAPGSYRFEFTAYLKKSGALHDIYTDKYYITV